MGLKDHAVWNFENFITIRCVFAYQSQHLSTGWNKGVQVGKFLKFNKVCCTIIWKTKVPIWNSDRFYEFG